mgnify:CR=1 FL=1
MLIEADSPGVQSRVTDYDAEAALVRLGRGRGGGPVVIGQLGQSLDGRIATPSGKSKYINGAEALRHLHAIRARVDAVVVGVGTAVADDPRLTTRHVRGPDPRRVVIDPSGRMPADRAMLADGAGQVTVITAPGARAAPGARHLTLEPDARGHLPPRAIVAALAEQGMRRILVEGGAETLARFIDAGAVDELHLMLAPIVLGSGKTGLNLSPIDTLDEAMRPKVRTMRFADGDMLCVCALQKAEAG